MGFYADRIKNHLVVMDEDAFDFIFEQLFDETDSEELKHMIQFFKDTLEYDEELKEEYIECFFSGGWWLHYDDVEEYADKYYLDYIEAKEQIKFMKWGN